MSNTFTVEGRVAGQKRPVLSDWHVELPPAPTRHGDSMKLRDLISTVVAKEVDAFRTRQQERRLALVMSKQQIEQGVQAGRVAPGERDLVQAVNIEDAISVALQAFTDGLYFVFIDDVQQMDLDAEVSVKTDSHVIFLRLTALVGG
jgi:hypothetical protein